MRKPLYKYNFLPRTVNEMNQFISLLCTSISTMKDSFNTIDIENIPKNTILPTNEQFEELQNDLKKMGEMYEQLALFKKSGKPNKISEWIYASSSLQPVMELSPIPLLKKENRYWMKKSDLFAVWSYWFRKENMLSKGIISNLPSPLEQLLGKSTLSWYEFQKIMYDMTEPDPNQNISQDWEDKWKKWKKNLTELNEEIKKKPKKQRVKKQKPTKKMVPSKTKTQS